MDGGGKLMTLALYAEREYNTPDTIWSIFLAIYPFGFQAFWSCVIFSHVFQKVILSVEDQDNSSLFYASSLSSFYS